MTKKVVVALAAVVIGWLLSEVSHLFRRRDDRTAAAGQALAELLEIRHYLHGIRLVFAEIKRHAHVSPSDLLAAMRWIDQLLPPDPKLPDRYEQAVSALAAGSPIAAFQLRSKDQVPALLVKVRSIQLTEPDFPDMLHVADDFLRDKGIAALDDSIRDLAWTHGLMTWIRIRRLLAVEPKLPVEVLDFMNKLSAKPPGAE